MTRINVIKSHFISQETNFSLVLFPTGNFRNNFLLFGFLGMNERTANHRTEIL